MGFGGSNDQSLALIVKAKNRASPTLRRIASDLDHISARSTGLSKGLLSMGKATAVGLGVAGVALAAFGVAGVVAFGKFEDKLTQSLAIMGNVAPAMRAEMEETARVVARTTRFSAAKAAEAYFYLASAGLDAQQSVASMPQVAAFAQAGMFDLARATDLATDAQSALGLTTKDAQANLQNMTRVTDVLVKANTLANASVEQFSEALTNKAGAAIKVVGKDIEEGVAVLAAFADQGIKGAEAGTALNIVFRDLQTKAIKNKSVFKEFGVAVFDAAGEMRNVGDIVGDLEGALEGMSDEQKKATLTQLGFSDKSVIFIQTLLGTSEKIKGYEDSLRSASGITEEVAGKQLLSLNAQFDLLKNNVNDVFIGLGEDLAPTIRDEVLPELQGLVLVLGNFTESVAPLLIKGIGLVTDAVVGSIWILQSWGEMFGLAEEGGADLTLILHEMAGGSLDSADAAVELENGLWALAKRTPLTTKSIEALTAVSGANTEQQRDALETTINWAYTIDEVTENTRLMEDALYSIEVALRSETWALAAAEEGAAALGIQIPQVATDTNLLAEAQTTAAEATEETEATMEDMTKVLKDVDEKARSAAQAFEENLFGSMSDFVSFFNEVPDELKLSLDQMEKNWTDNFALQDRYWTGISTLADAGFGDLTEALLRAGPEVAGQVEELAADLEKAAEFDGMIKEGEASMQELSGSITNALGIEKEAWAVAFFEAGQSMAAALTGALTGEDILAQLEAAGISMNTAIRAGLVQPLNFPLPFVKGLVTTGTRGYRGLAGGGSFYAGEPIVVGENGPEVLVPTTGGGIISNHDAFGSGGGPGGMGTSTGGGQGQIVVENMYVTVEDDLRDPGAGRRWIEKLSRDLESYNRERVS